jgi:hypothetical protein
MTIYGFAVITHCCYTTHGFPIFQYKCINLRSSSTIGNNMLQSLLFVIA